MTIRDIFVPLFPGVPFAAQLEVTADLALRLKAHADVVFTRPDPVIAAAAVPEMIAATGIVAEAIETEGKQAQSAAYQEFDRWRTAYGLLPSEDETAETGIAATWHERVGTVGATVVQIGLLSDLTVIVKPDRYEIVTEEAFAAAVFETGRPALVTPARVPQCLVNHVVIAWNDTLQAARAVHGAMPLLRLAERVSIFAPSQSTDDLSRNPGLIEHLRRHGVRAERMRTEDRIDDIGKALLEGAVQAHATMIVMGAYSHSRIREAVLGGVTRHVLKHADIPVLMAH
jgi:nucleotide-binding universal stress UspA family protein